MAYCLILFKLLSCINVFNKMTFLSFLFSETNLKFKMALEVTDKYLQEESAMADFNGLYSCIFIVTAMQTLLKQFTVQVNKTRVRIETLLMVLVTLELVAS